MPTYRVTWTQAATAAAAVSIELEELAAWAIATNAVHALDGGSGTAPDQLALRRSLEANPHLRDALLRLWVIGHE